MYIQFQQGHVIFDLFFNFVGSEIGPSGLSSKIINFHRTEGYCTKKWGKILPAVQWYYNKYSNYIVRRCTTSRDVSYIYTEKLYIHPTYLMVCFQLTHYRKFVQTLCTHMVIV